jgi:hypothetical protein
VGKSAVPRKTLAKTQRARLERAKLELKRQFGRNA